MGSSVRSPKELLSVVEEWRGSTRCSGSDLVYYKSTDSTALAFTDPLERILWLHIRSNARRALLIHSNRSITIRRLEVEVMFWTGLV